MPVYRVKKGQQINVNSVIHYEGDEVEVERHVAYELRNLLEATDEEGKLPEGPENEGVKASMQAGMRAHEKIQVLTLQKEDLERKLAQVHKGLEAAQAEVKSENEAREQRRQAAQGGAQRQEPIPAPNTRKPAQEA